jgi:hypothetical protein
MLRTRNLVISLIAVTSCLAGMGLGKAVRQGLAPADLESGAGGHAILNYAKGADKTEIQVNCRGLEPETVYTVLIYDDSQEAGTYDFVGGFTTDKNGKGNWHGRVEGDVSGFSVAILGDDATTVQLYYGGFQPWPPVPVPIDPLPCPLVGTDNIIVNFPSRSLVCPGIQLITYADVDNDPSTGVWVGQIWYPNETQIVLEPLQGDMAVNSQGLDGQIFFSFIGSNCGQSDWQTQKGKFVIRFIDATAPGWVWNDPTTWQERPIDAVTLRMCHDEHCNYQTYYGPNDERNVPNPNPYLQIKAYRHWYQNGLVSEVSQVGVWPCCELTSVSLTGGSDDFSELYVSTDFAENTIDDLCLFVRRCAWFIPRL